MIEAALAIIRVRLGRPGEVMANPETVKAFLRLHLADRDRECFMVVFLNAQHAVIDVEEMFRGTLTQTTVHPREIVRAAMRHNAAAVVLAHNHPSGVCEPSQADRYLTAAVKQSLALVDVRVLDHMVVGRETVVSMAERGEV